MEKILKQIIIPYIPITKNDKEEGDKVMNTLYDRLTSHLSAPYKHFKFVVLNYNLPGSTKEQRLDKLQIADYILPIISIDLILDEDLISKLQSVHKEKQNLILILGRSCLYKDTPIFDENIPILPDEKNFLIGNEENSINENQLTDITSKLKNIFTGFKGISVSKNIKYLWISSFCLIIGSFISIFIYFDSNDALLTLLTFCMFLVIGITSFLMYKNFSFTINLSFGK